MFLESISLLVTDKFWIALFLYGVFMFKPHRFMLILALMLAVFIVNTCLFWQPEYFMQKLDVVLTAGHFLPGAVNFDVPAESMSEIHKAFVMGCYWGLAGVGAFYMLYIPAKRLYLFK